MQFFIQAHDLIETMAVEGNREQSRAVEGVKWSGEGEEGEGGGEEEYEDGGEGGTGEEV